MARYFNIDGLQLSQKGLNALGKLYLGLPEGYWRTPFIELRRAGHRCVFTYPSQNLDGRDVE